MKVIWVDILDFFHYIKIYMRIISTNKQKDNLAKVFWDMGKVICNCSRFTAIRCPKWKIFV